MGIFLPTARGPCAISFSAVFAVQVCFWKLPNPEPFFFDRSICTLLNFYCNFLLGIYRKKLKTRWTLIIKQFFARYLQYEHYIYCVPSNVSSGLASLPLAHVWVDGNENTSWPTNTKLSTGDQLNGTETYAMILPYFTTNEMTPMDVHKLGKEQLAKLYPQVCTILHLFVGLSIWADSNKDKEDVTYTGSFLTPEKNSNLQGKLKNVRVSGRVENIWPEIRKNCVYCNSIYILCIFNKI